MLCLADGEPALEDALRDAFPHALFVNDFAHASDHLHACCLALGLKEEIAAREFRFCRRLLYRCGAESAARRLRRLHQEKHDASPDALRNLSYLEKRKDNMHYGWFRKQGYHIGSGHVEAAVRVLVVRRCKQAAACTGGTPTPYGWPPSTPATARTTRPPNLQQEKIASLAPQPRIYRRHCRTIAKKSSKTGLKKPKQTSQINHDFFENRGYL